MFDFFKNKSKSKVIGETEMGTMLHNEKSNIVTFAQNRKVTNAEVRAEMEVFSEVSDLGIFKGNIDHAYESDFTGYTDHCPKCDAPTKQMYSGFVYATQTKARVMSAPAGHFCTKCPTVIIDDEMIREAIPPGFKYGGTCALEGNQNEPNLFSTFNGKKSTYVLDENQQGMEGIIGSLNFIEHEGSMFMNADGTFLPTTLDKQKKAQAEKQKSKNRSKNRAAKKSRSGNKKK